MSIVSRCRFGFRGWTQSTSLVALGVAFFVSFVGDFVIAADEPAEEKYVAQIFIGNADGSEMRRLADLPEYQSQGSPSWSQDGRLIAFDAYNPQDGGRFSDAHLIVVNSDGGDVRDLGRGLMPSLSPRGHRIVYSTYGENGKGGGVWVLDVDDPKKRIQIDENGWGADWSPDGVHVAYARGNNLILYNMIEGTSEMIFDPNSSPVGYIRWNFSWSPDGRQIAFRASTKEDKSVLAVVDAKVGGHGFKVLYKGETYECVDWTPDGKQIVVPMRGPNREEPVRLFTINVEEPSEPRLFPNLPMNRKLADPSFSPDGKRLAIQAFKSTEEKYVAQIFVANADGTETRRLAVLPEYQSQGSPSWSQDGKRIAFDAYKPQNGERFSDAHLIVVDSDGVNARDLGRGMMPSLSPCGHRVVYSIHGDVDQGGVWIVDVEDPEKRIQIDGKGWGADWSPDGIHVAYARGNNLILCNMIEGTTEMIFDPSSSPVDHVFWNFSWSPNGRQIAFRAITKKNKRVLAIVDAKGGGHGYKVLYEGDTYECVDWTPDGKQIAFPMRDLSRDGLVRLFTVDVEDPSEPQLFPNLPTNRKVSDPSFSPDGKHLATQTFKQIPAAKE